MSSSDVCVDADELAGGLASAWHANIAACRRLRGPSPPAAGAVSAVVAMDGRIVGRASEYTFCQASRDASLTEQTAGIVGRALE